MIVTCKRVYPEKKLLSKYTLEGLGVILKPAETGKKQTTFGIHWIFEYLVSIFLGGGGCLTIGENYRFECTES